MSLIQEIVQEKEIHENKLKKEEKEKKKKRKETVKIGNVLKENARSYFKIRNG